MNSEDNPGPLIRTDDGILADIWDALWKEDTIRSLDMGSISIHVKDGEVYMTGHLAQENNPPLIDSIVRPVAGVVAEKVAGEAPSVRGVIALPRVTGESPNMPRRAVQLAMVMAQVAE